MIPRLAGLGLRGKPSKCVEPELTLAAQMWSEPINDLNSPVAKIHPSLRHLIRVLDESSTGNGARRAYAGEPTRPARHEHIFKHSHDR